MIDQLAGNAFVLGVSGGAMFGVSFALKKMAEGQDFDFTKFGLTVALAGLLGGVFEFVGYSPTPEEWLLWLFAFYGLVAETEVILKLLFRGHVNQARDRVGNLGDEAEEGIETMAGTVSEKRIETELRNRTPKGYGPGEDFDAAYERALERTEGADPEEGTDHPETEEDEPVITDGA